MSSENLPHGPRTVIEVGHPVHTGRILDPDGRLEGIEPRTDGGRHDRSDRLRAHGQRTETSRDRDRGASGRTTRHLISPSFFFESNFSNWDHVQQRLHTE